MDNAHNADDAELRKFADMAHHWWDPDGALRPLHQINPLRLAWIEGLCPLADKQVLDVGCGGGILTDAMARAGANATGIDLCMEALKVAELHALDTHTPRVQYRHTSAEALTQAQPASYDVVTCMEMLEHVPQPGDIVHACATLVQPGGWVFFSTINRNPKSFLFAIVGAEYLLRLVPRGTHSFRKLIRPSELSAMCRAAGLVVQEGAGISYNPITQHYWRNNDLSVNYLLAARRPS
ncbi:bifunctional 2-polyprenyl-6-hydroxyphenol methylase/3-demethylubiquinol 3-O-methyltransferase UbiG [Candidatus Symbiobacter mobilis]|uniref:Ubiquinone biosynthesis O-methyltransferase n=1 Tax=Candidatus Symbiobacter mobilis CR TaxID=946483 RepID=U5NBF7_9BURK|nr:bifunctional 2-polyprenyl-6-hydroxyphenol methylase/3-demethylubiquinol 3-O-methyltransferase UbiG [Candidatus Symbiobacter mobilis]AGX88757.1 3-demethylubiquinone 3-methyltransferase [Candidatus Symbiobacter mobilis CR]